MNGDILLLKHETGYMIGQSDHGTKETILKYYISIIKNPEVKMSVVKIVDQDINFLKSPNRTETLSTDIKRYEWRFSAFEKT